MTKLPRDQISDGCVIDSSEDTVSSSQYATKNTGIIYAGDPMCSWCWGASPEIKQLQRYCIDHDLQFSVIVGGLRPGGGDPWNSQFKNFLREHWEEIGELTNQPFGFELLDRDHFDYNTEPACRAVVSAKETLNDDSQFNEKLFAFFMSIQKKFYVEGEDPTQPSFYDSLCKQSDLNFDNFQDFFHSDLALKQTQLEFDLCRNLDVNGFPNILFNNESNIIKLASGYTKAQGIIEILENISVS